MKRTGLPRPQQQQQQQQQRKSAFMPTCLATPGKSRAAPDPRPLKEKSWQKSAVFRALNAIDNLGLQQLCASSMQPRAIWTLKEIYSVLEGFVAKIVDFGQAPAAIQPAADNKLRADQLFTNIEFLGYPYALTRQVISSPNTPHHWPLILGLIDYLCDRLDQREEILDRAELALRQPAECGLQLGDILRVQSDDYALFLQQAEDKESGHVEQLTESLLNLRRRELAEAEEEARAAAEEAKLWAERSVPAQRLRQELHELQERASRTEQDTERLRQQRAQLESELPVRDSELSGVKAQLERLRADCDLLADRIRSQPVSQAQVMSLRGDIKGKESYIARLDETLAETEKEIGMAETQLNADYDILAHVCNQTNMRLAKMGLSQRVIPELSEVAQEANASIKESLKRLLADLADNIELAGHRREEARKRLDALTDHVAALQSRLTTIFSLIESEKLARRQNEEAKLQEVNAAIEASEKQLADCEAARDRQRDRLARALVRQPQAADRLALAQAALARALATARETSRRAAAEIERIRAGWTAVDTAQRDTLERLAGVSHQCNRFLVTTVSDIVATGSPNLMAMLLPRIQAMLEEHRRGMQALDDGQDGHHQLLPDDPVLAAMLQERGGDAVRK